VLALVVGLVVVVALALALALVASARARHRLYSNRCRGAGEVSFMKAELILLVPRRSITSPSTSRLLTLKGVKVALYLFQ